MKLLSQNISIVINHRRSLKQVVTLLRIKSLQYNSVKSSHCNTYITLLHSIEQEILNTTDSFTFQLSTIYSIQLVVKYFYTIKRYVFI